MTNNSNGQILFGFLSEDDVLAMEEEAIREQVNKAGYADYSGLFDCSLGGGDDDE